MPKSNSNSFNGTGGFFAAVDDAKIRSMPWLFRVSIPGFQAGWPPAC
jgi:hypothetical protein